MSDNFMLKSLAGRKMHIRIGGKSTLTIYDKYDPSKPWDVRIPDRTVNRRGNICLCHNDDVGKGDTTYSISARELADAIEIHFFGMMSLMSEDFKRFVMAYKTIELEEAA